MQTQATPEHTVFAPSDDRIIFWISWIFLITQYPQKIADKYLGQDISRTVAMYGYIVFMAAFGLSVWKLFHQKRFTQIKNAIIGLQGFFLFHLFLFAAWLGVFLFFNMFLSDLPQWISSACGIAAFYGATFLGGCWIGYKNDRLISLWCIIGVILLYYGITMRIAAFNPKDIFFVLASIMFSIAGGYFGSRLIFPAPE